MKTVYFSKNVIEFIEKHAQLFKGKEIYGWLLGYEENNVQYVVAPYSCHEYTNQSLINAEPNLNELAALDTMLPEGISNLGIYHSHPKGVFHSNTDDKTLINMARNYPDIISIVTNGVDTHCYKVLNEEVIKVGIEYKKIKLAFTKVVIIFDLCLPKQQSYYNLAHIIENKLLENLDREWGSQKKSKEEIKFMLPTIDVGKDYTTSIEITLGIAQSSSIITSDDIRNQLSKIIYELVLSVSPTIRWLGSQLHYYFDIPMSILPNSFARNSAIKRSELLKHFNKKESNSWKKLKN